ncbi:hypothetical protein HPP92_006221, partial [Vanilla planifolia]
RKHDHAQGGYLFTPPERPGLQLRRRKDFLSRLLKKKPMEDANDSLNNGQSSSNGMLSVKQAEELKLKEKEEGKE